MNICIIATICKETGALTIYSQLMKHLREVGIEDNKYYIFVDPSMPTPNAKECIYIKYDTSGLHRFKFDGYDFKRICESIGIRPDVIFSLNNSGVRYKGIRQVVYYHQALPLYHNCFSPLCKRERSLWLFHYIYPLYVKMSLKENTSIVVQTKIIKKLFCKKFRFPDDRVYVAFPDMENISPSEVADYQYDGNNVNFLYPATSPKYKEHFSLVKILKQITNVDVLEHIRVHFTLKKGEFPDLEKSIKVAGLDKNFIFHGTVSHKQLLSMYKTADGLLFPSTIETIGLPLLEASAFGLPIITNDLAYAKDVLDGYEGHFVVKHNDYQAWARHIEQIFNKKMKYTKYQKQGTSDWNRVMNLIIYDSYINFK